MVQGGRTAGEQVLTARFVAAAMQLALTLSTLHTISEHVSRAMPTNCVLPGGGCRLSPGLADSRPAEMGFARPTALAAAGSGLRLGASCVLSLDSAEPRCRGLWEGLERPFAFELWCMMVLLTIELVSMVVGGLGCHAEVSGFFGAVGHLVGCVATALMLVSGASCELFHVVFVTCGILPFACELLAWVTLLRGGYPATIFEPPDGSIK